MHIGINTPSKCPQYPGVFITSPFRMFPDFGTSDLVLRRIVVQLRHMAFLNKIYSPRGVDFCPPISKSRVGTPLFISFLGFTYIELQVYKLLPKSECRFYLSGMTLIVIDLKKGTVRFPRSRFTSVLRDFCRGSPPCRFQVGKISVKL